MTALGEYLREWREKNNLTLHTVADAIGTSISTLSFIETGRFSMSDKVMRKLADFMQLSDKERVEFGILRNASRDVWKINMTKYTAEQRVVLASFVEHLSGGDGDER